MIIFNSLCNRMLCNIFRNCVTNGSSFFFVSFALLVAVDFFYFKSVFLFCIYRFSVCVQRVDAYCTIEYQMILCDDDDIG